MANVKPTKPLGHVEACNLDLSLAHAQWAQEARAQGSTIYANVGWDPSEQWPAQALENLCHVDVFVLNEQEAMSYARATSAAEAATVLAQRVNLVVITLGPRGALALQADSGELAQATALNVESVDPTGAGDSFTGAFIASAKYAIQNKWTLAQRLRFATTAASLSTRSLGGSCSAPQLAQVLAYAQM
jgi:sugar/nucleoside kinase (ribokinase family)